MKKFLALALILTLALSISVFGAKLTLGSNTGVETFEDTLDETTTISVSANVGTVLHRYAVDLEYTPLTVAVTGSTLTWNVTDMRYDITTEGTAPLEENRIANVVFKNRSDKDIDIEYTITDKTAADYLTVSVREHTAGTTYTVAKATAGVGGAQGTATTKTFVLEVIAKDTVNETANENADWASAAKYYADYFANNDLTSEIIATIGFTISMTPDPIPGA